MLNFNYIKQSKAPIRMFIFLLVLIVLWLPGAALIYGLMSVTYKNLNDSGTANLLSILTMGLLAIEFIAFLPWWGRQVYQYPNAIYRYGLVFTRENGLLLLKGLAIGFTTFLLFLMQGFLGWLTWQSPQLPFPQLILEGSLTAVGVGLAEELFFRGWMLDELDRDYQPQMSLMIDAAIFALLHFIKPIPVMLATLPQFPGLWLLGIMLVIAKRQHRNLLGISIGIHAGMVWLYYIINVGQMVRYSGQVPEWVTGINGNPLSGLLGILFLGVGINLLIFERRLLHQK
jgi:hypothetical protein